MSFAKGLPPTWSIASLGELGEWRGGGTPSKARPEFWTEGTIPWVSPKDMKTHRIVGSEDQITPQAVAHSSAKLIPSGSVLVVTRSGILEHSLPVAVTEVDATVNQDLKAVTPLPCVLPIFLSLALRAYEQEILQDCRKSGTTVASIEFPKLLDFEIPIPPLPEQRRIVAEIETQFTRLDAAVAALERARANLKRYRAAVLAAAVGGQLGTRAEGCCQLPSKLLPPEGDELPQLPSAWRWSVLDEVLVRIQAGKSFRCDERPPNGNEVGVAKVSAVTWGKYDELESKTCLDPARIDPSLYIAPGDFLFSRANTIELVGACVIAKQVSFPVMLSDKTLRFTLNDVDQRWILHYLRSAWGRHEIQRLSTGNQESMRNIGQDRIRRIRVPIPPPNEAEAISDEIEHRLSMVDLSDLAITHNLKRADRLRQSILRKAFAGELVPQDPDDEPASVLLERIQAERSASEPAKKTRRTSARQSDTISEVQRALL